jgi:hypothetical protein
MEAQLRSTDIVMSANGSGVGAGRRSRHEDAAPAPTAPRFDPRTRVLLEGPITSTLLRLATPNVLVMLMQADVAYVFVALGVALAAFGLITAGAVATGAWFGPIVWTRPRVLACAGGQCK